MNNLITNPQGIDFPIQYAQKIIYDDLTALWGLGLEGYGRVSKNERNDSVIPELKKQGKEYSGTLLTSSNKFFFIKGSKSEGLGGNYFKCKVEIYFILDLKKIKPNIAHRADQEVHKDVIHILSKCGFDSITEIIDTDLDTILRDFKGAYGKNKYQDLEPYHIFKVGVGINYNLNKC